MVNAMYVLNILPPLPLSLKEAGVYHAITRTANGYVVAEEEQPWYVFLQPQGTIHLPAGSPVYFYSAVFAPTRLTETRITHHWQYFDTQGDKWMSRSRIEFPIAGGTDGGYRGYSLKTNVTPGLWRVRVETARGKYSARNVFGWKKQRPHPH